MGVPPRSVVYRVRGMGRSTGTPVAAAPNHRGVALKAPVLKAVVFDVDGTLYRQPPMRRAMAARLLQAHALKPVHGWRTMHALRAYRRAQETLRERGTVGDIASAQVRLACDASALAPEFVVGCVTRWMDEEPLAFLPRCAQQGLVTFLEGCRSRGLRLGVLSDYPAAAKLRALGLAEWFDVVVSAQDKDVEAFKPNPRGLRLVLDRLGVAPEESLYVGDRADVDAPTAAAAGVRCAILSAAAPEGGETDHLRFADYGQLQHMLSH